MSGGTITLDRSSSGARDCRILAGSGTVTGGTLQFGGANTTLGSSFGIDSTPALWDVPEIRLAGGLDALRVLGKPTDVMREAKGRLFGV